MVKPAHWQRPLLAGTEFDSGAQAVALTWSEQAGQPLSVVVPLVSNPEYEMLAPDRVAHDEARVAARLQQLHEQAARRGVRLDLRLRRGPLAQLEIVDEAKRRLSDVLLIRRRRRRRGERGFLARLLMGELVSAETKQAPCSVLIAPRAAQPWRHGVLLALDPGRDAIRAPQHVALHEAARMSQGKAYLFKWWLL